MNHRQNYQWLLRDIMADHGIFATTGLAPLLAERGIDLSPSQVHRLVTQAPERLSMPILVALCDIFQCSPNDLISINASAHSRRHATGTTAAAATEPVERLVPKGTRPRRAIIAPDA